MAGRPNHTDMNTSHPQGSIHGQWSSRAAFVLAATGAAVGLGNIWKFPYIAGEHGGSVFVLVYILCVAVLGVPIMMAEVMLGRRGGRTPINSLRMLAVESGASRAWQIIGWGGTLAGVLILSYYSVIAGWTIAYIQHAVTGTFSGFTGDGASTLFTNSIKEKPPRPDRVSHPVHGDDHGHRGQRGASRIGKSRRLSDADARGAPADSRDLRRQHRALYGSARLFYSRPTSASFQAPASSRPWGTRFLP